MRYLILIVFALVSSAGVQSAWAMGNHSDVVRDQYGRALGGATITVYVAGTTDLADIYSDNGVTAKGNPLTSDTLDGRFNFYAANGVYDLVFSHPNATFDAAHTARISVIDASNVTGGSSTPVGLDEVFDVGAEINSATYANPMKVGNGTQKLEIFGDATMGGTIRPSPLGDSVWRCWTNFNCVIRDEEGAATIFTIDPNAASTRLMYEFGSNYRPRGYFYIPASAFIGDGTNCPTSASTVTINSGPKVYAMICGSGANGDMDFDTVMPMDWAGTDLIFEVTYRQTAANTSAMNSDIKSQCRGTGETPSSTWGTSANIDDAAVTGSSAEDKTASAAVTPAGTCTAGDHLFVRYTLDVTGTTTPEATLQFEGVGVYYEKRYWGN